MTGHINEEPWATIDRENERSRMREFKKNPPNNDDYRLIDSRQSRTVSRNFMNFNRRFDAAWVLYWRRRRVYIYMRVGGWG